MTSEQNKLLVRRLVEGAANSGNLDVLDEVAEGGFAVAARRWIGPFQDFFPDFTMEIADLVTDSEKVPRISGALAPTWGMDGPSADWPGVSRMSMRSTSSG